VQAIIAERRGITGDTALPNLRRDYEFEGAAETLGSRLDKEVKARAA
jgi:hypothetical protein